MPMSEKTKKKYLVVNKKSSLNSIDKADLIPISWDILPAELMLLVTDEDYVYFSFILTDDFMISTAPVIYLFPVSDDEFHDGDYSTVETDEYILGFDSDDIPFGH